MIRSITISIVMLFFSLAFAQEKNEVERRIKKNEVPEKAVEWLNDAYENRPKTKWYFQTDGEQKAYEAKLKHKKQLHSVEFNLEGEVQNIEVLIKEKEIDEDVQKVIKNYFETNYEKFSISKIQIQYTGKEDDLEDMIDEDELEDITITYEIEYYGKSDTEDELWEGIFDEEGIFLEKRVVKIKATDNLDY